MHMCSRILRRLLFEWHVGCGLRNFNRSKYESALMHIERALSLVDDVRLQVYRAIALLRMGRVELAAQVLAQNEARCSGDVASLVLFARAYSELRLHERVRSLCEAALRVDSKNIVATSLLALALLEQGESDNALKLLEDGELADDAKIQSRILALLESLARERQVWEQNAHGDIEGALKELKSTPNKPIPIVSAIVSWWHAWSGTRCASKESVRESIIHFARALKHAPSNFSLRFALGILLLDAGMPKLAQMVLEDADAQGAQPDYHLLKGAIHLHFGEFDGALAEFELADQSFAVTHYYIGLCELCAGKPDTAVSEFEMAFELDPAFVRERIRELVKRLRMAMSDEEPKAKSAGDEEAI